MHSKTSGHTFIKKRRKTGVGEVEHGGGGVGENGGGPSYERGRGRKFLMI